MKFVFFMKVLIIFLIIGLFVSLIRGDNFKINRVYPDQEIISLLKGNNLSLSIAENNYDSVKWYLNGKLIKSGGDSFELKNLDSNIYTVRVDVIKGKEVDSKTWNVIIKEDIVVNETKLDVFEMMYYIYISVLLIMILLMVRLFIIEKRKH